MSRKLLSLVVLLAAMILAAPSSASAAISRAQACPGAYTAPNASTVVRARAATICLMNYERTIRRLPALRFNSALALAGARHAGNMAARRYFSHVAPGGVSFVTRILRSGYTRPGTSWSMGENIAWGQGTLSTPASTVGAWMRSPGHRANVLKTTFREVGVGAVLGSPIGGAGAIYAAEYGRRG